MAFYNGYNAGFLYLQAQTNNGGDAGLGFGAGGRTNMPGSGGASNGTNGSNYGGGGSGGYFLNLAGANAGGGNGAPGIVIITEFCFA
jgi:hypothetical protein